MHRFLLNDAPGDEAILPAAEARHALKVLRVRPGQEVRLTDGRGGQWAALVSSIEGEEVRCRVLDALPGGESPARITLYQGIPKADKLEWIAQKAAELGVSRICPVAMSRSVSKWEAKEAPRKLERLLRIGQEALKQCGRAREMEIGPVLGWGEALSHMAARELMLMPWEDARDERMADACRRRPEARDIGILIGPEGGIAPAEAEAARAAGALAVTLGPRILRCETAAICGCALAQQLWGDM